MFLLWLCFISFIIALLALDLGVFHRKAHVISCKEALAWSSFWITLGLSFSFFIYFAYQDNWFGLGLKPDLVDGVRLTGRIAVEKYLTGYIVEKSLSVDNIFVIAMLFSYFAVPPIYQHRVLFWGILGALLMRGAMIILGAKLIAEFHWILYVFGAFLIVTGLKMLLIRVDHQDDPNKNIIVRLIRKLFPITRNFYGEHFYIIAQDPRYTSRPEYEKNLADDPILFKAKAGTIMLTPLALALVMVEITDVIFAVDSIPAIFAITADPFIVFSSNVFAILGLRSLYFALADMITRFTYLKISLAFILLLIGIKMFIAEWLRELVGEDFNFYLLAVILLILTIGAVASWQKNRKDNKIVQ